MRAGEPVSATAAAAPGPIEAGGRTRALASLRHRNYRLLWFGTLVSSSGDWMDQVALNWLIVSRLGGGGVELGLLYVCRLTPILVFTLIGGVVADRMERRRLLFTTQAVAMLLAFALAVLVSTGLVQFWMVLAIAVGRGVMLSFNMPARQSLISELVPPEQLMNAVALNSATLNLTRVLGPAIGGVLLATVGVAGAFYLNGASFVAVLAALAVMRFPEARKRPARTGMLTELSGGMRYVRSEPVLLSLVVIAVVPMVFGMPYQAMAALFARDVLDIGGAGLGVLTALSGVGAVVGALCIASLPSRAPAGPIMLFGLAAFGVTLLVFAASSTLWLSAVAIVGVGMAQQVYNASNTSLLQLHAADEFRGRVMSMLFLGRGMIPLGALLAGVGASLVGVQWAMGAMAVVLIVLAVASARLAPRLRAL